MRTICTLSVRNFIYGHRRVGTWRIGCFSFALALLLGITADWCLTARACACATALLVSDELDPPPTLTSVLVEVCDDDSCAARFLAGFGLPIDPQSSARSAGAHKPLMLGDLRSRTSWWRSLLSSLPQVLCRQGQCWICQGIPSVRRTPRGSQNRYLRCPSGVQASMRRRVIADVDAPKMFRNAPPARSSSQQTTVLLASRASVELRS